MEEKENRLLLEREPNRIKQAPKILAHALSSVKQTNMRFKVVWSHGKALWIEVWITFKAEKEKWIKTKANPCHLQESNLFRPAVLSIGIVHEIFPSLTGDWDIPVVIELKVYLKILQNSHWRHHQNHHPDYPDDLSHWRFHLPSHLRSVCLSTYPLNPSCRRVSTKLASLQPLLKA